MILEGMEMLGVFNPWRCLQQPVDRSYGINESFRKLLAVIDKCWNGCRFSEAV